MESHFSQGRVAHISTVFNNRFEIQPVCSGPCNRLACHRIIQLLSFSIPADPLTGDIVFEFVHRARIYLMCPYLCATKNSIMKRIFTLLIAFLFVAGITSVNAQKAKWTEMEDFHKVMSQT